ncbi:FAD-binding oxidoreductase [Lichenihabitans psoromatis]|uniref:FAD-binding oxidoreductase n=1 Tax=Lichenihabitans psoromatis TaxID=2528642 RepID=UPI0013F155D9|nr:FAD-binding oxidoreductase [Lichenihabitans psoromatis]
MDLDHGARGSSSSLVDDLRAVLGPNGLLTDEHDLAGYGGSQPGTSTRNILAIARPASVQEVALVLRSCRDWSVPIIPRGGGTGLAGGAVVGTEAAAVVLSLERMQRIRELDTVGNTMIVESGCTLATAREAAAKAGRSIGLDHGGSGSSQIGGNLATNAGGNNVLRYGTARDQVLGLEAVLADGSVIGDLTGLRKSNAGYDLKGLLIGSEGTLGVITAAALKLRLAPVARSTALLGIASPAHALSLLTLAGEIIGDQVSAFEMMSKSAVALHFEHTEAGQWPLATEADYIVLIECDSSSRFFDLDAAFEALLEAALERGVVSDGAIAASGAQRDAMWKIREGIPAALHRARYPVVTTDTAVPVSAVPNFIAAVEDGASGLAPGGVSVVFGHVGDGNIHFNVLSREPDDWDAFRAAMPALYRMTEDVALALGGTVSAEHGIGQSKREALLRMKSPVEMALMRGVRTLFDPGGILNPGKIFVPLDPRSSRDRDRT